MGIIQKQRKSAIDMPPKCSKPSTKTEQKQKEKIIEDKTFGLKNKNKSKTVQKYIKGVAQQVMAKGGPKQLNEQEVLRQQKKKEDEQKALLNSLFKNMESVSKNVGPIKTKEDIELERRTGNIDIYTDQRQQIYGEEDNMETWDQKRLEEVVNTQQGKYKFSKPTEIICKYFLDAIEKSRYGWSWVCPNGMSCIYRHCLPPGYVFKPKTVKKDDGEEEVAVEDAIDEQIANLGSATRTPVTLESFLKWKEVKKVQKAQEQEKKRKEEAKKAGTKGFTILSGRALFTYDPTLFQDDADAAGDQDYEEDQDGGEWGVDIGNENEQENGYWNQDGDVQEEEKEEEDPEDSQQDKQQGEDDGEDGENKNGEKAKDENVKIDENVFLDEDDVDFE
eukprot:TRINITY_DN1489_c0_g1_i4.p1 TRINITY_DN1489_c0_g1~~TRINITY_DN1489_c0_g1_i4.p1  ORF type:complete len:390 (+),score=127.55 TRINITY_DN1489_c0_g1_i4:151-1320(+)